MPRLTVAVLSFEGRHLLEVILPRAPKPELGYTITGRNVEVLSLPENIGVSVCLSEG